MSEQVDAGGRGKEGKAHAPPRSLVTQSECVYDQFALAIMSAAW